MTLSSFSMLSMTFAIYHEFPALENGLPNFHDQGTGHPAKLWQNKILWLWRLWSRCNNAISRYY